MNLVEVIIMLERILPVGYSKAHNTKLFCHFHGRLTKVLFRNVCIIVYAQFRMLPLQAALSAGPHLQTASRPEIAMPLLAIIIMNLINRDELFGNLKRLRKFR